jgi:S1-C subfamily serine protease
MSVLDELQHAAAAVAERVGPATVAIGRDHRGAGVVLASGQVLTSAHNLRDRTTSVTFADGRTEQGTVRGIDADGDLVVLDVDTGDVPAVGWAPAPPALGQAVFAVARRDGLRVTFGLVSGTDRTFRGPQGRRIAGSIEHTAALARGSTGGALTDSEGRIVAINTLRLGDRFALARAADGDFQALVARLQAGESPRRRRLGVALAPAHVARRLRRSVGLPERDGLLVRGVEDGSPAQDAGIHGGDLLVAAGDRPLERADDLFAVLEGLGDGGVLRLTVVRGTEERTVDVTFPAPDASAETGSAESRSEAEPDASSE